MSNDSLRQANNMKAGVFVTLALIVGLVVIFMLGDLWTKVFGPSLVSYRTTFSVVDGIGYLQPGSEVRVGGIKVGQVDGVSFEVTSDKPVELIDVKFSIPADMALYSNAVATIKNGLISADSGISISSVGFDLSSQPSDSNGTPGVRLKAGDSFGGTGSSGMLGSLLGPQSSDHVASALVNIDEITDKLNSQGGMFEAMLGVQADADLDQTLANLSDISTKLKTDGYILQWVLGAPSSEEVRQALANIDVMIADAEQRWSSSWSNEISSTLSNLDSTMDRVNRIVSDNEAKLNAIVSDVADFARTANEEWSPQLTAILDSGRSALDHFDVVIAEVQNQSPLMLQNLGQTLANLNVGSQQLNRAIGEVSASPWRLLYRPTDKEYSNELLYEAARNFSFGAADLRSATGSLQRLLEARGDEVGGEDEDLMLIRDNLIESFRRYERAQQQLMDILRGDQSQTSDSPGS